MNVLCVLILSKAKSSSGDVYSWGIGECGELGRLTHPLKKKIGDEMDYSLPDVLNHVTPGLMYSYVDSSDPLKTSSSINTNTQLDGKFEEIKYIIYI